MCCGRGTRVGSLVAARAPVMIDCKSDQSTLDVTSTKVIVKLTCVPIHAPAAVRPRRGLLRREDEGR